VTASAPASGPLLLFVTVRGCDPPDAPASCGAKPKLAGTEIAAWVAIPDRATVAGLPPGTFSVADRLPGGADIAGLNSTLIWQLFPVARLGAQGVPSAKSFALPPVNVIPVIPAADVPVFKIVTACEAEVVPSLCGENGRADGETCRDGGAVAVPDKAICCGLPPALSAKLMLAALSPPDAGSNWTATAQLAAMATVPPPVGQVVPAAAIANSVELEPAIEMPVMSIAALPAFVSVTLCGPLMLPVGSLPKSSEDGDRFAIGAGSVPVPASGTTCIAFATPSELSKKSISA
jgi:hypothetical protein